jgi:alanyl-tRNA synthetase
MGGQIGDSGEISGQSGRFSVTNTIRVPTDIIMHQGSVADGSLSVGEEVTAGVGRERRLDIARNHTATHLLQYALRQVLGGHVQQSGSLVAPDQFRFDFSHLSAMTSQEINAVQSLVNEKIRQNLSVYGEELTYKKAIEEGAIALFAEKYGDMVRVLKMGRPPVSTELCGGTHVDATGEIGSLQIVSESSIGAGLRRIEAVTGRGAEAYVENLLSEWKEIAQVVDASTDSVKNKVSSMADALDTERRQRQAVERELIRLRSESLVGQTEIVNGIKVLVAKVPASRIEMLRDMSDHLRERMQSGIIVLGSVYEGRPVFLAVVAQDLVARGYDAGKIVREVAKVAGGGGGGKPTLAQAGGKYKDKVDEALRMVKSLI